MFVNTMPRYEIVPADGIGVLDRGWRRIVSEIGIQFAKPEAVELFAKAGQRTDGEVVFLDPEFVLEQVAKAPREYDVQARDPDNNVHIGGDHMVFSAVYGCPFVREGDVRREATLRDFHQLCMLSQGFDELDSAGGVICEPNDAPLDSRHLDMIYALQTLTDKIYMGNVVSGPNAADTIAMTSILFGGRVAVVRHPGVGHRPAVHRAAGPALRAAVPDRRRAELVADGRRPVRVRGADDAAADVPGRHQLRHALGRLAGGRPGQLLREVHHRHRAAARAAGGVHAAGDFRGVASLRRARGGRARRALPGLGAHP